jgi:O-antigen/teichoic acid export membrane protein
MNLRRNVLAVLLQTIVTAICLFLSYRVLVTNLGVGMLGIWSLLLSVSAVLRVADVSGTSALSRFLALPDEKRPGDFAPLVSTLTLTSLLINCVLAIFLFLLLQMLVPRLVDAEFKDAATELLPWMSGLLFLSSMATAVVAGLDGIQRADQRAYVLTIAAVLSLLITWFLVPRLGATGFALAQLAQQVFVIVVGWALLRRHVRGLGILPFIWDTDILRKTLPYTLSLNLTGIAALLFEPLVKFALNSSGGPVLVGHFELANKACSMLRGLAVSAAIPLVPAFASYADSKDPKLVSGISTAHKWFSAFAVGMALAACLAAPIVSFVVLGKIDTGIIHIAFILSAGWAINMLATPTYLAAQGQGFLQWNIASHFLLGAAVSAGLYFSSAPYVSPVVWAMTAGLVLGAVLIIWGNTVAMRNTGLLKHDLPWLMAAATCCLLTAGLAVAISRAYSF